MNELSSIALILLLALLAGHLVKFIHVPEVTGYILAGIAVGPSMLGWINEQNLASLSIFSEVALALILFSIGSIFEFRRFREVGKTIVVITLIECALVTSLVTAAALFMGQKWETALLLGTVAMETGAASTLMVLREYNADGPLTQVITGAIAINNLVCLTCFLLLTSGLQLAGRLGMGDGASLYSTVYSVIWQLIGSAALGYLVGLLLAAWSTKVTEHGETLILLIGSVLLCAGLAVLLNLSILVVSLVLGATTANLSAHTGRLAQVQSRTDPPFYAVFFVIAGAHLQLGLLKTLGLLGLAYILARAVGKLTGTYLGSKLVKAPRSVSARLGPSVLAHAGLAIGLVLSLSRQYPQVNAELTAVVLGGILVYEVIGPISVRKMILRAGESHARIAEAMEVLE